MRLQTSEFPMTTALRLSTNMRSSALLVGPVALRKVSGVCCVHSSPGRFSLRCHGMFPSHQISWDPIASSLSDMVPHQDTLHADCFAFFCGTFFFSHTIITWHPIALFLSWMRSSLVVVSPGFQLLHFWEAEVSRTKKWTWAL